MDIFTFICCKNCNECLKGQKIIKRGWGWPISFKDGRRASKIFCVCLTCVVYLRRLLASFTFCFQRLHYLAVPRGDVHRSIHLTRCTQPENICSGKKHLIGPKAWLLPVTVVRLHVGDLHAVGWVRVHEHW